ncbi:hypothetical protein Pst134EB_016595 [Puccinia striiformis f. sp. tritici]|nr:hypothetical protein Pst134EB_016595 [Puccinia striiformis f. sp. tritici]
MMSSNNGRTSSLGSRLFASSLDPVSLVKLHLLYSIISCVLCCITSDSVSLRIVLARISILIFKTPRYTSIIKSICDLVVRLIVTYYCCSFLLLVLIHCSILHCSGFGYKL